MHAKGIQKTAQRIAPGGLTHEGYIPSCARSFFMTMESSRSVFSIVGKLKIGQYFAEESSLKV